MGRRDQHFRNSGDWKVFLGLAVGWCLALAAVSGSAAVGAILLVGMALATAATMRG